MEIKLPSGTLIKFLPGQAICMAIAIMPSGKCLEGIIDPAIVEEKEEDALNWEDLLSKIKEDRDLYWGKLQFENSIGIFFCRFSEE